MVERTGDGAGYADVIPIVATAAPPFAIHEVVPTFDPAGPTSSSG